MKITIFGTGYVGLVTGTCLAEVGHDVICIDIDTEKVESLKKGRIPIYEPGLEELVLRNYKLGRLMFSTDAQRGVEHGQVIFSAVGTPPLENHKADLKFVKEVAKTVGKYMNEYKVFVNKSTVPVGTAKICREIIQKTSGGDNFSIVSNPEFLREGTAVKDFMVPERIVCGIDSNTAKQYMSEVYAPFQRNYVKMIWIDIASAEIAKYAANAFLATKLSFINEIANFAELSGGNIHDIALSIGSDSRIGNKFLHAGIGYGGSCFPKDVNALIETGKDYGYDFKIIRSADEINISQQLKALEKLLKHLPNLKGKTITLLGLSFKPKTDDIRDAPSLVIIRKLLDNGVKSIQCYDPVAIKNTKKYFGKEEKISYKNSSLEALQNSDALLLLTEWDEFRGLNKKDMLASMRGNIIIDGRNIWEKNSFPEGVIYEGIGK